MARLATRFHAGSVSISNGPIHRAEFVCHNQTDPLPNRACHCPLHRRVLQSRQATLSARLPQPNPVRKTGVRLGKCLSTFSRQVHGLDVRLAKEVAEQLMAHDALASHARDELGISDSLAARPLQAAVASAVSFVVGGAVPLRGLD